MDPRMGRRSGHDHLAVPDIISPRAARLNGGSRSVRPGQGRPSHGSALGGTGPHSRRPNHAGGARRGDGLEDIFESSEAESRLDPRAYASGRRRGEDTRVPLGGRRSAGGYQNDSAEEEDELGGRVDSHRHNNPRGGPPSQRADLRGRRQPGLDEIHGRSGPNGARPSERDGIGGRRQPGLGDNLSLGGAGAGPGRHHPSSQRDGHGPRGRESLQDNERYGGSRREGGNRARDPSEVTHSELKAGPSRASLARPGTKVESASREQAGRFVPFTFRMLHSSHVDFLAKTLKVRTSKVREWCREDLIRMDTKRAGEINIDPLLSRLTSKDREHWEKTLQRMGNERQIAAATGRGPRHVPTSYENGFYAGQASVLHERRTGGHR